LDDAQLRAEIAKLNEAASRLSYSSSATAATFRQVGKSMGLADETISNAVHGIRQIGTGVTSFTRALTASEQSFSRYTSTVDQVTSGLTGIFGGFGLLSDALGKLGDVTQALVGAVFKQNDAYISAYDNLSKFGLAGKATADDLYELTLGTGYTSDKLKDLVDITTGLGPNLTSLGKTSGDGMLAFVNMTKITNEQRAELIRLGYSFKEITVNQADYIKLLGKMGKVKAATNSTIQLESLKYSKELTQLAALTGQSVDQLKEGQQRDLNDYKFNVFMQQEREKAEKGLGGRFEEYRDAVSKMGADFGDKARVGFREILSTGLANQSEEAKALFNLTRGEIITWTAQYKSGKMTFAELEAKLAQAQKTAISTQGEAMTRNKEFADMMAQSAEMQAGASKDYQNQSKDLIKREQEEASKPKEGGLKETQIAFMEAEMKVQSAFDALVKIVAEYVNPAFTNLMKGLDEFTSGLIKKFADWGVVPADFPHMFKSASDLSAALSNKQRELSQLQSDINDPKKVRERAGADSPVARGEIAQAVAFPELEKIKMQAEIRNLQRDIETMSKILREKFKVTPPATQTVPHSGGGDFSQMTKMISENQNIIDPKGFTEISKTFVPPIDNSGMMKLLDQILTIFKGERENPFVQKEKSNEQKDFGISKGPVTGYQSEMSKELQAVVPLPDGQSIPVSFQNLPKELLSKKENPLLETENLKGLLGKYATSIINKTDVNNTFDVKQPEENISELLNLLSSKMDTMLGNLTTNNNLQNDLLTYMRR